MTDNVKDVVIANVKAKFHTDNNEADSYGKLFNVIQNIAIEVAVSVVEEYERVKSSK